MAEDAGATLLGDFGDWRKATIRSEVVMWFTAFLSCGASHCVQGVMGQAMVGRRR
jgi:hypothetical protein